MRGIGARGCWVSRSLVALRDALVGCPFRWSRMAGSRIGWPWIAFPPFRTHRINMSDEARTIRGVAAEYSDHAKAKFATEADGWLVAYSMVRGTTVVTNEQPRPDSRSRVPLPDVCSQFKVPSKDTFTMLRSLAVKPDLRAKRVP
ncbi:MAG: DUF4411 family protein [Planctomycetes bacterium]|nr:DUF4411 family protein [Planctomycetota bacterium]